jgi:4-hydroxybenzoate polyprenyltransferase
MPTKVMALLRASHPGPSAVVTAIAVILGIDLGYPPGRLVVLAVAILAGQLSIGWSNDWIDAGRDSAVHRADKPIARGAIRTGTVRAAAFVALAVAVILSLLLGPLATIAHLVAVASAWSYNLRLKATVFSFVPFFVSFGLLPAIATLGQVTPRVPAPWVVVVAGLLGVAAHFANVIPDLQDDRRTNIRGLPHILGARVAGVSAFTCLAATTALLAFGPGPIERPALWVGLGVGMGIAALGAALSLRATPTRLLMSLIMTGALVDVVMLALAGRSILA